ncbi:hypothetical protein MKW94_029278 [Papaver nudicaule]|uniref:Dof zinc finger protein n=1 Tax=Papaver nudicaule TaxID=74823 RepID=A0AA41RRM6_PAPNU|nr:hypothetical protein [Papaver nudicaule]
MIQELLGGVSGVLGGGERKVPINCAAGGIRVLEGSSAYSHPSNTINTNANTTASANTTSNNTANTTTATATATATTTSSDQQNLRCPRCDSANTKFCYYNNYNLTQPRHFCKTCRRYWTKGGALRNVPIGGGCRKNKGSIVSTNSVKTNSNGKIRTAAPDIVKSSLGFGYDHELTPSHNQIIWPSQQPQSSQLLALLRANTPNPNQNRNPTSIKEEGNMMGSHMMTDSAVSSMGALNGRSLSLDPMGNSTAPFSLCSSFWRNNNQQQTPQQQQQQQQGFLVGEVQNTGIQELYQRLRSSANYYSSDNSSASVLNSVAATAPTNASSMFEPAATVIAGGELGYNWNNPSFNWSNLSTANGAFP